MQVTVAILQHRHRPSFISSFHSYREPSNVLVGLGRIEQWEVEVCLSLLDIYPQVD